MGREESLPSELLQVTAAFKTVQILGQVLRGSPGSIVGERKLEIARECYSLGTRTTQFLIGLVAEHQTEFTDLMSEIVASQRPSLRRKPDELRTIAGRLVFDLCAAFCQRVDRPHF